MHLKDNLLRAFVDQELSATQTRQAREHLMRCPDCQGRMEEMSRRMKQVQANLAPLSPTADERPRSPSVAYRRFSGRTRRPERQKETITHMLKRKPVWAALTIVVALTLVFTITPARAWASSFLSMFRIQRVQVFTFDPAAMDSARGRMEASEEAMKQVFQDDLEITEHGDIIEVGSVEEAAEKAGFTPRVPTALTDPRFAVKPGMNAVLTIDQPKLQALMDSLGVDVQLPESVNGQVVTVDVPDAVAISGCAEGEDCPSLIQLPSPTVNAPDEFDVPRMGEAMFQFLGLSPMEARQLSQRIDWTSTLVLPIPQDETVRLEDVQVDGVTGNLIQGKDDTGSMLIWVKDGILYGLRVPGTPEEALSLAATLP